MILAVISASVVLSMAEIRPDTASHKVSCDHGVDGLLQSFNQHSIVLLGEMHWSRAEHQFIQKLLRDPRLPGIVNDIAIEAGNSLYQPIIDRYVAGRSVPTDSLRLAWRNTTQPLAWDPPVYAAIYKTVHDVNRSLPGSKRMRVIALDPPIEWQSVHSMADFPRIWGYRDPVWFATLESEVLAKHRRVLVITGGLHILRLDPPKFTPQPFDRVGLGDALAQRYDPQTFRIYPLMGIKGLSALFRGKPSGTMMSVKNTPIAVRSSEILWPSGVTMLRKVNGKTESYTLQSSEYPTIGALIDAVMYFGQDTTSAVPSQSQYRDCAYVTELRRRNELLVPIFGLDRGPTIDSLAAGRCKS